MPTLKTHFPELNIYIGCKDDKTHLLKEYTNVLKLTEIKIRRNDFAYVTEIKFNGKTHPIEDFLINAKITNFGISTIEKPKTIKNVIITKGTHPTVPLDIQKIDKLKRLASGTCEIDGNITGAGFVAGVESVELCEAAANGIETILVPTGMGVRLYKTLFPKIKVLA